MVSHATTHRHNYTMNQEKMKMFEKIGKEESRNSESIFNPLKPEGIKIILFFFFLRYSSNAETSATKTQMSKYL